MKELYHAKIAVQIFSNSLISFGFQKKNKNDCKRSRIKEIRNFKPSQSDT